MSSKSRRITAFVLVGVASVLLFVTSFAVWANRQALDSENWTQTSSELLANEDINQALQQYLVTQIYLTADVKDQLERQLPPRLKPLAAPAAMGLRELTDDAAHKLLTSQKFQSLWRKANLFAHSTFIKIMNDEGKALHLKNGAIMLDLRELVILVASQAGIDQSTINKLPAQLGEIELVKADQLEEAQSIYKLVKPVVVVLSILTLLCYIGAVAIAPSGLRRRTLFIAGVSITAVGLLVLVLRRVGGHIVVDELAKTQSATKPTQAVWDIGTSMLVDIAWATVCYGVLFILAAAVAGPTKYAVKLREWIAPVMQLHPGYIYAGFALVVFVILLWGPLPSTRQLIPILVLLALAVLGIELLKRQVQREFPVGTSSMLNQG